MFSANAEPSTAFETAEQREADFDGKDECRIPMVVFSSLNQEEDAARETVVNECDDRCDNECDSFDPPDLVAFAWQIARGMVRMSLGQIECRKTKTKVITLTNHNRRRQSNELIRGQLHKT